MIDVTTNKPLRVSTDYPPRPSIEVALSQLEELQQVLDKHGFRYEVLENAISMNDGPFTTDIIFARGTDANAVQAILDSVA
jgi:N-dimethylarginine dimethylaminohydrolase